MIYAIDPGTTESALVMLDGLDLDGMFLGPNENLLERLRMAEGRRALLAVEMVASYGMPVGREVFETVLWAGRFVEAWGGDCRLVYRKEVKSHLCHSMRAKDSNVRQALLDRYPRTGGGKTPQVGTKNRPGPLYGVKSDLWSALAVGITTLETPARERELIVHGLEG